MSREKIKMADIAYVEYMCNGIIKSLESFATEQTQQEYVHSSSNRAKFKRLRVELAKELMDIQNRIY